MLSMYSHDILVCVGYLRHDTEDFGVSVSLGIYSNVLVCKVVEMTLTNMKALV